MNLMSLRRNVGYKLLSLLIALVLYYVAYSQQDPRTTRQVLVQPRVTNLASELTLAEPLPTRNVNVSGYTSAINALKPQDITGQVNLAGVGPGVHNVAVDYIFPVGVRGDVLPQNRTVKVTLQKKEAQNFAVDAFVTGTAPVGFEYAEGVPQPRSVIVRGPTDELARVARVVARVEAGENEGRIQRTVNLTAEDSQKRVVDNVEIEPTRVTVRADLRRLPVRKRLLVSVDIQGEPAPGYTLKAYSPDPDQVIAVGPVDAFAGRSNIEIAVDVSGIRTSETRTVRIQPPVGLRLDGPASVRVRLTVEPIEERTTRPTPTPLPSAIPAPSPSPIPAPRPSAGASPGGGSTNNGGSGGGSGSGD